MEQEKVDPYRLNDHQETDFHKFENLLTSWRGGYQCVVISYVGVKVAQTPCLLFGRIYLEPSRIGINDTSFHFETEHIIAARFVADAPWPDIISFLIKARTCEDLSLGGISIPRLERDGYLSVFFSPTYPPSASEGPNLAWPCLLIRGIQRHNLLLKVTDTQQLDLELKAADLPFDNLDDLLIQCGLPTIMQMGDSTTLEIVAKSPGIIGTESTIVDGEARIVCHVASALDVGKIRIGYKTFQKELVLEERASVSGSSLEWRRENDIKIGICRIRLGDASLLQAFLSYSGVALYQWWVTDPKKLLNPRYAIHQAFDKDMESLKKMLLEQDSDKAPAFEGAVSTLFNLLGFSVMNYGRIPKLQRGPDIIAVAPNGNIGVIECTVGLLNENDKLDKVVQRTMLIKEKLISAGYGHLQIQAAVVTPLPRSGVTANLEIAAKHSIAVLCKEEIEELLKQTGLPSNADRLFQDVKRLIPASEHGPLP